MADYIKLKDAITEVIKTNGNQEITGQILQNTLLSIVNVIGEDRTFAGVAEPDTNPGNPDQNVIWAATQKGTYTGFGNYVHDGVGIAFLGNTTSGWQAVKMNVVGVDSDGNPVNPDSYVTKEAFERFKKDLVAELTDTSDANNIHARFDSHGNVIFDYYATKQSVDALIKEIGSESTSESEDGSVWGKLISLVQDTTVHSKEISDLNDESDNLQADMTKVKSDILKLNEDMDNAYTQNGFLFSNSGRIDVFFNSDSGSIVFPSRMKLSYANIMIDVLDQPQLSIAYGSNTYFLVFDLSDRHLKLGNYNDQMSNTVLLGWIDTLNKIAIINASIVRVNMRSANPADYLLKTEVIDDLTGTEKDEALSANMGRILSTQNAMMQYTAADKYVDVNFSSTDTSVTVTLPSGLSLSYGNTRISESSSTEGTVLTDNMSNGRIKYLVYDLRTSAYKLVNFDGQMNNSILVGWINQYLKEAILKCNRYRVDGVSQSFDNYIQKSDIIDSLVTTVTNKPLSANMGTTLTNLRGHIINRSVNYPKVNFSSNGVRIDWGGQKTIVRGNTVYEIDTPPALDISFANGIYGFIVYDTTTGTFKYSTLSNSLRNGTLVGEINGLNKTCILYTDIWEVDGKRMNPTDYISTSDIVHNLTTTDENKVLGADQAGALATQNGMMQCTISGSKVEVNYNANYTEITISFPPELHITYGNSRIINASTSNGTVVKATSGDSFGKYLVYNLVTNSFEIVKYDSQMKDCILLGWMYLKPYLGNCILLCDDYSVNGMPASNNSLAEIAYDNIPTTVIQLKKNSDKGEILIQLTALIDTEVKITGGRASFDPTDFRLSSVSIKKEVPTNVYFRCIETFAVIEAKGVYKITNSTTNNNCYVIGNVRDFGEGATHISLASNNNVTGEIKDFNRKMTYILINSGTFSNPKLSGKFEDLPRLLTHLRLTSAGISITGNVSDLPRKLTYMYLNTGSTIDMSGDVSDFPRGLIDVMLVGSNYIIYGNVSDLPPNLDTLQISGESTVSGNILDLPRPLTNLYLVGKCNLKGSLADLPKNINYLSFQSTDSANPITGDINDIPNKEVVYLRLFQNFNVTFNGEFPMSDQMYYFQLQPSEAFPIDSATVDNILIKLAAIAGERTRTRTIDLTGACAAPTEASQSAIESLQQKGFTVTTNK